MILTNPCSEIYLEDWFPEDRINKDELVLTKEEASSYMGQFLSLVQEQINTLFPGHQNMSPEELSSWSQLFFTFDDFCINKDVDLFMGVILTINYRSDSASTGTLLYCIKVCRNIFLNSPSSAESRYREFSRHVHLILGNLIPPRSAPNGV